MSFTHVRPNGTISTNHIPNSRNHSMSQADYDRTPKSPLQHHHSTMQNNNGNMPFKPVPPPKPKNYRPIITNNGSTSNGNMQSNQWDTTVCIYLLKSSKSFITKTYLLEICGFYFASGWFT